jgi:hypothetical protein
MIRGLAGTPAAGAHCEFYRLGTFGGPTHGAGVPAINVAAQAGQIDAVQALLDAGADPTIRDAIHGGMAEGWAEFGGHPKVAALIRERL